MQPDVLSILIGINDTWRRYDSNLPMTVEEYEANYRRLVQDVKENTKAKLLLLEPFLLHADPAKECFREDLDPKILAARRWRGIMPTCSCRWTACWPPRQ